MRSWPPTAQLHRSPAPTTSVTYTAVLPVREHTVDALAGLRTTKRARRGTRALPCRDQAVLILRCS
ncbi:hypothetical protein NDQ86_23495, partial [Salinispora arenicola]|nr:hypothetical protein [Salinispora arenicola]